MKSQETLNFKQCLLLVCSEKWPTHADAVCLCVCEYVCMCSLEVCNVISEIICLDRLTSTFSW